MSDKIELGFLLLNSTYLGTGTDNPVIVKAAAMLREQDADINALYLDRNVHFARAERACVERDEARVKAERLHLLLARCRTILNNMAWEREGKWGNRWHINHEPLRADAKALLPMVDEELRAQ